MRLGDFVKSPRNHLTTLRKIMTDNTFFVGDSNSMVRSHLLAMRGARKIRWRRERDSNSRGLHQWFSRPPPYRAWLSRLMARNNLHIY